MSVPGAILLGAIRPVADALDFVTPIFVSMRWECVVQRTVGERIAGFVEIELREDFIPVPVPQFVQIGDPAVYGIELEDRVCLGSFRWINETLSRWPTGESRRFQQLLRNERAEEPTQILGDLFDGYDIAPGMCSWQTLAQQLDADYPRLLHSALESARSRAGFRSRTTHPLRRALAQRNLAGLICTQYADIEREDRSALFTEAVRACQNALQLYTRKDHPLDWALTMHNLARALAGQHRSSSSVEEGDEQEMPALASIAFSDAMSIYESRNERIPGAKALKAYLADTSGVEATGVPVARTQGFRWDGKTPSPYRLYDVAADRVAGPMNHRLPWENLCDISKTVYESPRRMRPRRLRNEVFQERTLPIATFPSETKEFVESCISPYGWKRLDPDIRQLLLTSGTRLQPVAQITPPTATPVISGFECRAMSSAGEDLSKICARAREFDPGLLRICLASTAIRSARLLLQQLEERGHLGANRLFFLTVLDPLMVQHDFFTAFLSWIHHDIAGNIVFEVNESTAYQVISRLDDINRVRSLGFAAEDVSSWSEDVRARLLERITITTVSSATFDQTMAMRRDDPVETIRLLRQHKISNKPLVVDGVNDQRMWFLAQNWEFKRSGTLYGLGPGVSWGEPWEGTMTSLKNYGLSGGGFLTRSDETGDFPEYSS